MTMAEVGVECLTDSHCSPIEACSGSNTCQVCEVNCQFVDLGAIPVWQNQCNWVNQCTGQVIMTMSCATCPNFCVVGDYDSGSGECILGCLDDADCASGEVCVAGSCLNP